MSKEMLSVNRSLYEIYVRGLRVVFCWHAEAAILVDNALLFAHCRNIIYSRAELSILPPDPIRHI